MNDVVSTYVASVRAKLHGPAWHIDPIIEEINAHLLESVDELVAGGMTESDAIDLAIARFGDADQVAQRFNVESPPRLTLKRRLTNLITEPAMLTKAIIALAVLTMLGATINVYFSFEQPDELSRWTALKVMASMLIVGVGLFSVAAVRRRNGHAGITMGVALAILAFGLMGGAFAVLMGEMRGDFEGPIVLVNMLLVCQGTLVALFVWNRRRKRATT